MLLRYRYIRHYYHLDVRYVLTRITDDDLATYRDYGEIEWKYIKTWRPFVCMGCRETFPSHITAWRTVTGSPGIELWRLCEECMGKILEYGRLVKEIA